MTGAAPRRTMDLYRQFERCGHPSSQSHDRIRGSVTRTLVIVDLDRHCSTEGPASDTGSGCCPVDLLRPCRTGRAICAGGRSMHCTLGIRGQRIANHSLVSEEDASRTILTGVFDLPLVAESVLLWVPLRVAGQSRALLAHVYLDRSMPASRIVLRSGAGIRIRQADHRQRKDPYGKHRDSNSRSAPARRRLLLDLLGFGAAVGPAAAMIGQDVSTASCRLHTQLIVKPIACRAVSRTHHSDHPQQNHHDGLITIGRRRIRTRMPNPTQPTQVPRRGPAAPT